MKKVPKFIMSLRNYDDIEVKTPQDLSLLKVRVDLSFPKKY